MLQRVPFHGRPAAVSVLLPPVALHECPAAAPALRGPRRDNPTSCARARGVRSLGPQRRSSAKKTTGPQGYTWLHVRRCRGAPGGPPLQRFAGPTPGVQTSQTESAAAAPHHSTIPCPAAHAPRGTAVPPPSHAHGLWKQEMGGRGGRGGHSSPWGSSRDSSPRRAIRGLGGGGVRGSPKKKIWTSK